MSTNSPHGSLFPFPFFPVVRRLSDIGWTCGCWTGYPNRWYKRARLVAWLADRFDPMEEPW